jgi:hypothetical protein
MTIFLARENNNLLRTVPKENLRPTDDCVYWNNLIQISNISNVISQMLGTGNVSKCHAGINGGMFLYCHAVICQMLYVGPWDTLNNLSRLNSDCLSVTRPVIELFSRNFFSIDH